jgi:uncharacterized protein (DUF2235 family)
METPATRRLVLCLDGTWNNAERGKVVQGGRTRFEPTNVLKTYRAVLPVGPDGATQIAYYNEGVGAFVGEPSRLLRLQTVSDRLFGGLYGGGFEGGVKSAYRFLVGNYRPGDQIFVFGFSRGSAQARSLVRFVHWLGGVLAKEDEYYIPELFSRFRSSRAAPGEAAAAIAHIRGRGTRGEGAIREPRPVTVRFLGVYDTVLALGLRLRADRSEGEVQTVAPRLAFHLGPTPPPIVETARQAVAIDEARWDYRAHVWTGPGASGQSLVQRWFPGVHTQVGGGREKGGLENAALQWMTGEATQAGLVLDADYLEKYRPFSRHEPIGKTSRAFRWIDGLRGKRGRGVRPLDRGPASGVTLDGSALELLGLEASYRPANLLDYLAAHPEAVETLEPPDARAAVARIVGEHRGLRG